MLTPAPILVAFGSVTITAHGVAFAAGALAGYAALLALARRRHLPADGLAERVLAIFAAGLLCARVGYFLVYPSRFESFAQMLSIWEGGLVSFFGIAGGLGAAWLVFPRRRAEWLGLVSVAALAAWGIGRVGNFFEGDSVGVISTVWGPFYGRVPIQLFESAVCLALYAFWRRRTETPNLTAWVLASYLAARFVVDFWRDEGMAGPLHNGQWFSLLALIPLLAYLHAKR